MTDNPFEIPQAMRDLAETNIKQAHAVYDRLTDFISETIDTWVDAIPANPMAEGFMYVQDRATEIAMENADAASEFVSQISDARTFEDIVMLETRFVQNRMQAFVAQTQQLYGLIGEALQASALGAAGAGTGAMPSNPLITGLADVHNRAEEIAKMNAELGVRASRKDCQGANSPRYFDTSNAVRSRADASLRCADGRAAGANRECLPEAIARTI